MNRDPIGVAFALKREELQSMCISREFFSELWRLCTSIGVKKVEFLIVLCVLFGVTLLVMLWVPFFKSFYNFVCVICGYYVGKNVGPISPKIKKKQSASF